MRSQNLEVAERSRLRIFVIRVLVASLMLTLLGRLWFVQVASGASYQHQAQAQSKRELIVQPPRGLVVDAMGRPLIANRSSWVISVDRTLFGRLDEAHQKAVLHRLAKTLKRSLGEIKKRTSLCGQEGADAELCWNGSPFQPIRIASDVPQKLAVKVLEQAENYPSVLAQRETVRAYPAPYGVNAAQLLGYVSPITEGEFEAAEADEDKTLNAASLVGRAGVEKSYDTYLRGEPGYQQVAVDSRGRVLGETDELAAQPGQTLVTSLDARLQGLVERQLHETIMTARQTHDKVTGRNYEADSGAAVVMEAKTGRILAMASQPTYDPSIWVGGIKKRQLDRLYSKDAGTPLLSRATQGQFAPGSTWKPIMAIGAMNNGYSPETRLDCSSGLQVGNRWFKNYESRAYGSMDFASALQLSCDTFFYRIAVNYWQKLGSDPAKVGARDPLVETAKDWGFGSETGVDIPGEASGRIADRQWKLDYWKARKDHYCKIDKEKNAPRDYLHLFAHEFCLEGNLYRTGDAVNFSIGQGDTVITPLQLAKSYAAIANGGTLYQPTVGKAIVDAQGKPVRKIKPKVAGTVPGSGEVLKYVDDALAGTTRQGTLAWRFNGFPLDEVPIHGKTGTAEVWGKQTTSWVATYSEDYVVIMMVSQGGTGSGTSGPAVRKIWESLYGVTDGAPNKKKSILFGGAPPKSLPTFADDGSILPPSPRRGR